MYDRPHTHIADHGGFEYGVVDPGATLPGTTEAAEMIQIRDLVVAELRSRKGSRCRVGTAHHWGNYFLEVA